MRRVTPAESAAARMRRASSTCAARGRATVVIITSPSLPEQGERDVAVPLGGPLEVVERDALVDCVGVLREGRAVADGGDGALAREVAPVRAELVGAELRAGRGG